VLDQLDPENPASADDQSMRYRRLSELRDLRVESRGKSCRSEAGVDPSVETASKRDSCGWLLRTLQQQG
jgi:hypothetical protein